MKSLLLKTVDSICFGVQRIFAAAIAKCKQMQEDYYDVRLELLE